MNRKQFLVLSISTAAVSTFAACGEEYGPDVPDTGRVDVPGDNKDVDSERWFDAPDVATGREFRCLIARGYYDPAVWCYEVKR